MKTALSTAGGATFAPVTSRINLNRLQNNIFTVMDSLPPSRWGSGMSFPNSEGAPLRVYRDGRHLVFSHGRRILETLNHGKKNNEKLEPNREFRTRVKEVLQRIAQANPEVAQIMVNEA